MQLVFVTVPNVDAGRKIAKVLLEGRHAACVNILPGMESHYRWEGELHQDPECLLIIKGGNDFAALSAAVKNHHPYECAEIVAVKPDAVEEAYAKWWGENAGSDLRRP